MIKIQFLVITFLVKIYIFKKISSLKSTIVFFKNNNHQKKNLCVVKKNEISKKNVHLQAPLELS